MLVHERGEACGHFKAEILEPTRRDWHWKFCQASSSRNLFGTWTSLVVFGAGDVTVTEVGGVEIASAPRERTVSDATLPTSSPMHQLELLHARHYVALVRLAVALVDRLETAEDIVQEAFLQLFRNWSRLRDTGAADAYLRRAVVNRSRDELRARRVRRAHSPRRLIPVPSSEEQVFLAERERLLLNALKALPHKQREVLALRYFVGLSERETAAVVGRPLGTVKSAAHRGIAALREALGDSLDPHGDP